MSMLNLHDPSCDAYSVAPGCERAPCTCPPMPPPAPREDRGEGAVEVADDRTKLLDITVALPVNIDRAVFVFDSNGKPLGTAVLTFVHGGLQARLFLDPHNPVVFDLANEPDRCIFKLHARIVDGSLDKATLSLDSK